jgi:hypothetical protein
LKPGTQYVLTATAKAASTAGGVRVRLKGAADIEVLRFDSDRFQTLSTTITLPQDVNGLRIEANNTTAEGWVDDISLVPAMETSATAAGASEHALAGPGAPGKAFLTFAPCPGGVRLAVHGAEGDYELKVADPRGRMVGTVQGSTTGSRESFVPLRASGVYYVRGTAGAETLRTRYWHGLSR